MSMNKSNDRRRFFRITDEIGVAYEVIEDESTSEEQDVCEVQDKMDFDSLLSYHNELVSKTLAELSEQQPQAANAIEAINKKLDVLLQLFELDNLSSHYSFQHIEEVNISACGVAFPVKESISLGTQVKLVLCLQPDNTEVNVLGKAVDCQPLGGDNYYLRLEFVDMSDADRERLIQHIVQRQRVLLRSLREQVEDAG